MNQNAIQILIVEDDRVLRRVLEFTLRRAGFRVIPAGSPAEAMPVLKTAPVDLMITDHQMPGMTGMDLIRWSADNALPPSRCLLCTAKGLELDTDRITGSMGVAAVVVKPFSPSAMVEIVSRLAASIEPATCPPRPDRATAKPQAVIATSPTSTVRPAVAVPSAVAVRPATLGASGRPGADGSTRADFDLKTAPATTHA